jgi:hypothetical protein
VTEPKKPRRPPVPTQAEIEKAFVEQGLAMLGPDARRRALAVRLAPGDELAGLLAVVKIPKLIV